MADLLSRFRGKTFYLLLLTVLFISGCNSNDDDEPVTPAPVMNSAPVISSSTAETATAGTPFTYMLAASDADNDPLRFQASLLPSWLSFNATTGELTGTPSRAEAGDYDVTLAVSDGSNSTPLFLTVSVVIVNEAPVITSTAVNNAVVGSAYSYTLTATDIDADTLVNATVSTLPTWATFDAATGALTGTPDVAGDVEIELSVSDGALTVNQKFTLVVTATPAVVIGFDETIAFADFGGAVTDVITNPDASGINTSANVGRMQKFAGEVFGGTTIVLDSPFTLEGNVRVNRPLSSASFKGKAISSNNVFTLKVWSQRQVALTFKLEGDTDANDVERVVSHDGTGWEVLSFDFTGVSGTGYTAITLIFENGVAGDAAGDAANWTFYFDDMVIPVVAVDNGDGGGSSPGPELISNGGFDAGLAGWKEIGVVVMEGTNSIYQADVQAAGNAFDVNQGQVLALEADSDYILTFKAKASVARSMIVGIGLNYAPFTNAQETVAMTTEWQTFTLNLTTTGFGDANNRAFFDMGAEVGLVSIDDVSLRLASVDNGGDITGPELVSNGTFDAGLASWKEIGVVVMEGTNSIYQADVQAAGNAFDVNQGQVLALEADSDYILTFKAKASVARSMIVGIGLNYAPFTNAQETVAMTTEWQTFTLNLTTTGFGDANNRVFFDMGAEIGLVSIDDVSLKLASVDNGGDTGGGDMTGPELAANGTFDAGLASWKEIGVVVMEGTNSIYQADVQAAGNAFDVNQGQVLALVPDSDYILSFRAKASVPRSMIVGIGLNYAPFTNAQETVAMTTEWQTFTLNLTTTGFGDANNRIFFDMGAEVGLISIDDVSLKLVTGGDTGGGDTGGDASGQLATNGDFEAGNLSGWEVNENGGSITADDTQDNGGTWVAKVVAGPLHNPAFSQAGLAAGTVMPGDTINVSFDMCGSLASGGVVFPALLSEFGGGTGADRQNLETIATPPAVWTRYNYSAVAGNNVTGGVSLQLDVVCGGDAACAAEVYFDNVSITIDGGAVAGDASGNSCIAGGDTGGGDTGGGTGSDVAVGTDVAVNGDFENAYEGWNEIGAIVTADGNSFFEADVQAAGNPWDVNLSQIVELVQGSGYTLTFKAKASVARSIIAGIGQNYAPFLNDTETVALTTEWVTYTLNLTASDFGDANNRILFDMGAEVGVVSLDDVTLTLASVAGGGSGGGDTGGGAVADLAVELVVFENEALPQWAAWTDGRGPTEVLQDGDNGGVTKFTLTAPTVAGFTSRDGGGAVNGMTFDASALTNGIITFDFKMVKAPDAGLVDWKFKVESSTSTNAEVNLSTSVEGHSAPILDTWQTYRFPIAALVAAGLDAANIDLFMVFPDYNSATGAEFYLDNFKITSGGEVPVAGGSSSMSGGDLVVNVADGISFEGTEAQQASWDVFENGVNPPLEFVANPSMVGNTTDQVAKITLGAADAGTGRFAGAVTRTVQEFELSASTAIVKIWVYKDKISPVGVKFEKFNGDGYGSHGELTVSNTKTNEWEQLTIDFTGEIGRPENDAITGIAIFPDMVDGRAATVAYFDEITFTAN